MREDALRAQIASDPHSPRKSRVIGPTRKIDRWYEAFTPDRFYLKPEARARV